MGKGNGTKDLMIMSEKMMERRRLENSTACTLRTRGKDEMVKSFEDIRQLKTMSESQRRALDKDERQIPEREKEDSSVFDLKELQQ